MDKEDTAYMYTYSEILVSHQTWNLVIYDTWMAFEGIMLSEISQMEKDKYRMISFLWNI